jgi:hypothetical protein
MKRFAEGGSIGGGRVTRFLLEGWRRGGPMPSTVRVADGNAGVLNALKRDFPKIAAVAAADAAIVSACRAKLSGRYKRIRA